MEVTVIPAMFSWNTHENSKVRTKYVPLERGKSFLTGNPLDTGSGDKNTITHLGLTNRIIKRQIDFNLLSRFGVNFNIAKFCFPIMFNANWVLHLGERELGKGLIHGQIGNSIPGEMTLE